MQCTPIPSPKAWLALVTALIAGSLAAFACFNHADKPASAAHGAADPATAGPVPAVPVLVELFTSEGCSSCPPADALLASLDATQPVPGAHAIVLSEHVTYWNNLGWRDPFSDETYTDRQQQYVSQMRLQSPYTPQAVVDGTADVLGSDARAMGRAVALAAATPKPQLAIGPPVWQGDAVHFTVRSDHPVHAPLMAALAEDVAPSSVTRGENAGRTLHHVAVVRTIRNMGTGAADGRPLTLKLGSANGAAQSLRLVVFLADAQSGKVLAASEAPVAR